MGIRCGWRLRWKWISTCTDRDCFADGSLRRAVFLWAGFVVGSRDSSRPPRCARLGTLGMTTRGDGRACEVQTDGMFRLLFQVDVLDLVDWVAQEAGTEALEFFGGVGCEEAEAWGGSAFAFFVRWRG